jgi:hypothetical protein
LLSPGYPVFFNYASILPTKAPPSLQVYTNTQSYIDHPVSLHIVHFSLQEGTSVSKAG